MFAQAIASAFVDRLDSPVSIAHPGPFAPLWVDSLWTQPMKRALTSLRAKAVDGHAKPKL